MAALLLLALAALGGFFLALGLPLAVALVALLLALEALLGPLRLLLAALLLPDLALLFADLPLLFVAGLAFQQLLLPLGLALLVLLLAAEQVLFPQALALGPLLLGQLLVFQAGFGLPLAEGDLRLLLLLALLVALLFGALAVAAHEADGDHHQGDQNEQTDIDILQHGVHAGDKGQERREGHAVHRGQIDRSVILPAVDHGDRPQDIPLFDGGGGGVLLELHPQLQAGGVILAGDHGRDGLGGLHQHMGALRGKAHGDLFQVALRVQQGGGRKALKAPGHQALALGKLLALDLAVGPGGVVGAQDHGDEGVPLLLGGGDETVAGLAGAAGLDADGPAEGIAGELGGGEQGVGVQQHAFTRHICGGHDIAGRGDDLPEGRVGHGLLGHAIDVPGRGVMLAVVQAVGVHKVGAGHAQLLGPLVHPLDKGRDVPTDGHGQDIGRLVGGGQHQAVEQVVDGDLFPGLQVRRGGIGGQVLQGGGVHRHYGRQVQLPAPHSLQGEQGRHDLGDAGGVALPIGVLLVEDLVGVQVDEQAGGGFEGDRLDALIVNGAGKGGHEAREQRQDHAKRKGANQRFFHRKEPHPVL